MISQPGGDPDGLDVYRHVPVGTAKTQASRRVWAGFLVRWTVAALIWGAAGTVLFLRFDSNLVVYNAVVEHGASTTATVVATYPSDHNGITYSFVVDGRTYQGGWFADPPNPPAKALSPGDQITIVYDTRNPAVSCSCEPERDLRSERSFGFWGISIFSALAGLAITRLALGWLAVVLGRDFIMLRQPWRSEQDAPEPGRR